MTPAKTHHRINQSNFKRIAALVVTLSCIATCPTVVVAQIGSAEMLPAGQKESPYAGLTPDEALNKALEIVTKLEESERDPDENQDERTEYVETLEIVERVLEIDAFNKTAGYVKGRLFVLSGRPRAALPMIEEYVADAAGLNDWRAYRILGDLYAQSFPKHAVSKYRQAIELAENEPEPYIGLARAHLHLNNSQDAVEQAQHAIRLDKKGKATYQATLAKALMMDRKFEDAARASEAAVKMSEEKFSNNPTLKSVLIDLQGHYDLRLECVSALATLYPERADYIIDLARIWQDKADLERVVSYHQALVMIERAKTYPQLKVSAELLYEEARLNRLVSRDDKAMMALDQLLQLDPNHAAALELKKLIESEGRGLTEVSSTAISDIRE